MAFLLYRAKVQVQPVECFFYKLVARDVVSGVVDQMFLLVFGRAEQAVERK